jgi:hypothetical protein
VNPWGLIIIGLGLMMIIIGFKGSQHSVIDALKNTSGPVTATAPPAQSAPTAGGTSGLTAM